MIDGDHSFATLQTRAPSTEHQLVNIQHTQPQQQQPTLPAGLVHQHDSRFSVASPTHVAIPNQQQLTLIHPFNNGSELSAAASAAGCKQSVHLFPLFFI